MTSYSFMHTLSSPRKEFCPSIKPGGKTREGRRDGRFQRGNPAPNVVFMIIYSRAYHGGRITQIACNSSQRETRICETYTHGRISHRDFIRQFLHVFTVTKFFRLLLIFLPVMCTCPACSHKGTHPPPGAP